MASTDKPDHYEVLGVKKDAPLAAIKSAFTKIAFTCHPDRVRQRKDLNEQQAEELIKKFKLASEANDVLTDPKKREAYDRFGHRGVENLAAGKSAASGQTYEEAAGGRMKRTYSEEDTMSFFDKRKEQNDRSGGSDDGLSPAERRERARQERMARRGRGGETTSTTPSVSEPFDGASSANVFHDVAEKVGEAADKLRSGVTIPLDVLEKFRDNLADFSKEVDKAISRVKPGGPKFS